MKDSIVGGQYGVGDTGRPPWTFRFMKNPDEGGEDHGLILHLDKEIATHIIKQLHTDRARDSQLDAGRGTYQSKNFLGGTQNWSKHWELVPGVDAARCVREGGGPIQQDTEEKDYEKTSWTRRQVKIIFRRCAAFFYQRQPTNGNGFSEPAGAWRRSEREAWASRMIYRSTQDAFMSR